MKIGLQYLRTLLPASMVLFAYLLLVNNYFGNVEEVIHADGEGYYDYLPSTFIHHDLDRRGTTVAADPDRYARVMGYPDHEGMKLNKYGIGTALLQAPFFAQALCATPRDGSARDGYQPAFHKAVFHASLCYLFLSLVLLQGILQRMGVRQGIAFLMQVLMGLGTAVTHYANSDASYSHIYALFAVSLWVYFTVRYLQGHRRRDLVLLMASLGLVALVRQSNVLVVLAFPFLAGSWEGFKAALSSMFSDARGLAAGLLAFSALVFLQCLVWYLQVGKWVVYSYGDEGFDFTRPELFNLLFSYQKGLFIYTPVLLLGLVGVAWMALRREYFKAGSWLLWFLGWSYVLASWWMWYYGCSYGMRVFIDQYPLFFIPAALLLEQARTKAKWLLLLPAFACIPLNIVQTYQYKWCILHWEFMNETMYWDAFLRTDPKYRGMFFKARPRDAEHELLREYVVGDVPDSPGVALPLLDLHPADLPDMSRAKFVRIAFDSDFRHASDTRIILSIRAEGGGESYHWTEKYLLNFHEDALETWHRGQYSYMLRPIPAGTPVELSLTLVPGNMASPLQNLSLQLWAGKSSSE